MSDVMIEARDLTKRYGAVTALSKASFEVRKGEVLGFLGPNGAGKTTTMKILTCFIAPTEGTAKVAGRDVFEDPMGVRQALGYLPEHNPLYPDMLVVEYLEWAAQMRGIKGEEATKKIKKAVESTRIGDVAAKEIRQLSKGYRQRVGLAQALLHEPPILILDEPMSGLDPNQAVEIRDLIKEIGKQRTVILSTHNLAEVQVACSRVLIVAKGKIVADDTPDALRSRSGRARFYATFAGGDDKNGAAREALGKIPGVDRVKPLGGAAKDEIQFEIQPAGSDDLRGAIFRAAVDAGLVMLELRREGQGLEGVFRDLTIGAGADAAAKEMEKKQRATERRKVREERDAKKADADADEQDEDEGEGAEAPEAEAAKKDEPDAEAEKKDEPEADKKDEPAADADGKKEEG